MSTLSAEEAAKYLYDAGFRGDDLAKMVAIGRRESRYKTDAHRTDQAKSAVSGDRGLFQINYIHDKSLMQAGIINGKADLFDPAKNAAAAFYLYKKAGLQPWNAGSGGWQSNGDPLHGTNYDNAKAATDRFLADPAAYGSARISSAGSPEPITVPDRDTQYDPTYTPPEVDPEAQKGLTDMLSRFGVAYPNAPRATPQLLAFMNGLGMSYDTLEDVARGQQSRVEGRSADSMADIARGDQRKQTAIAATQQKRNVLSSGSTNTKFARQAEDRIAAEADVTRKKAEDIGQISENRAMGEDVLRQSATTRVIGEETKQAEEQARAEENVRVFEQRQTETDQISAENKATRDAYIRQQVDLYKNVGLGV